jgi:hypothetical protein
MMAEVIFFQPEPDTALHRKVVSRVMHRVVEEIASEQSGENRRSEPAEKDNKKGVKDNRERETNDWRHDQPAGVVRVIMVHAVEHEVEALAPSALWFVMENPAMHRVLDQGPDQEPADEQACNRTEGLSARPSREVEHISHEGQINDGAVSPDAHERKTP